MVPNYFIHFQYLCRSQLPTDLFTFFRAQTKSYCFRGRFIYYQNFFMSVMFLKPPQCFSLRRMGSIAAYRHRLEMSAPLYPSVFLMICQRSTFYSTFSYFMFIFRSYRLPFYVGRGMYILFQSLLLRASSKSHGLLVAASTITNLFYSLLLEVAPSICTSSYVFTLLKIIGTFGWISLRFLFSCRLKRRFSRRI